MQPDKSSLVFLNYLSTAFENIKDAVLLIGVESDNKYRLLLANKVFHKMSGFPTNSVGKLVSEIVSPKGYTSLTQKYQNIIKTRKPHEYTEWFDVPAGRLAFEVQMLPILNAVGECTQIIVITRNITELEELRKEILSLRKRLDKSNS